MPYNEQETRFFLIDRVLWDKGYADCRRFDAKYVFATSGHLYGEFDFFTHLQAGPTPFANFPSHADLTARYAKDTSIDLARPQAAMLTAPRGWCPAITRMPPCLISKRSTLMSSPTLMTARLHKSSKTLKPKAVSLPTP